MKNKTIKVSMTSFIDFTLRPDSQKPAKVREIREFKYSPAIDYWKPLREQIIYLHESGSKLDILDEIPYLDPKKLFNYQKAINGYKKFYYKYDFKWFKPPTGSWSYNGIQINVNPELGLNVDGQPHLIKLYFKEFTSPAEIQLNKSRAGSVAYLMWESLSSKCPKDTKMSLLNVSKGQLLTPTLGNRDQQISLYGSVNSFLYYWENA